MSHIFISYSYEDREFARQLCEALEAHKYSVRMNSVPIEAVSIESDPAESRSTESFSIASVQAKNNKLIEEAKACVFILSPAFLRSEQCRKEAECAGAANKRLIPILRQDVDTAGLAPTLVRKNYILMRDRDNFPVGLQELREALDTDLQYAISDIFISYKHKDKAFVKELYDQLTADERTVWVDWKGIRPGDKYQRSIDKAIEGARVCLFVLSPEHIDSEYCNQEVEHAIATDKRIIPILRRDVDPAKLNKVLAEKNFIMLREEDDFDAGMARLREALDTDYAWGHAYTRLWTRASEWDKHNREDSLLLQGSDLKKAEEWQADDSAANRQRPTRLQIEYIQHSRRIANRRHRFLIMGVTVALCLTAILGVISIWEGKLARSESARKKIMEKSARLARASAFNMRAVAALDEGDASSAEVYSVQALEYEDQEQDREETCERLVEGRAISLPLTWPTKVQESTRQTSSHPDALHPATLQTGNFSLDASALQPDGKAFAICCPRVDEAQKTASRPPDWQDGAIWIGTVTRSNPAFRLRDSAPPPHPGSNDFQGAVRLAFCPTGKFIAAADKMGHVCIWRFDLQARLSHVSVRLPVMSSKVQSLALSYDGRWLAAGGADGKIRLWDTRNGLPVQTLTGHEATVSTLTFSPDGQRLASGSWDHNVKVWQADNQAGSHASSQNDYIARRAPSFSLTIARSAVSATSRTAASRLSFHLRYTLRKHEDQVQSLAFNAGGDKLASGSDDNLICVWNLQQYDNAQTKSAGTNKQKANKQEANKQEANKQEANKPEQRMRALYKRAGVSGEVGTEQSEPEKVLHGHQNSILSLAFNHIGPSPGRWLISGSADRTARLWDLEEGETNLMLGGHQSDVSGVAFSISETYSPGVQKQPSAHSDYSVQVGSLETNGARRCWSLSRAGQRPELRTLTPPPVRGASSALSAAVFNPAVPAQVAAGGWDRAVHFWNGEALLPDQSLSHSEDIMCMAYSPDGRLFAYGCREHKDAKNFPIQNATLQLRETHSLNRPLPLPKDSARRFAATVRSVTFSSEGLLAACTDDGALLVWKVEEKGEEKREAKAENRREKKGENALRPLVRPQIWGCYQVPPAPSGERSKVLCAVFSNDGKYIAVGSEDGSVYRVEVQSGGPPTRKASEAPVLKLLYPAKPGTGDGIAIWGIGCSSDGNRLAFANEKGRLLVCDANTGQLSPEALGPEAEHAHRGAVWSLAYSPDGRWIATAGQDSTVRLWDVQHKTSHLLRCSRRPVWWVAFSPDSKRLASCGLEGKVRIWNIDALNTLFTVAGSGFKNLEQESEQHSGLPWDDAQSSYLTR